MKRNRRFLLLFTMLVAVYAHSTTFLVDGVYYRTKGRHSVELAGFDTIVFIDNVLTIRSKVEYNGHTYQVERIGDDAIWKKSNKIVPRNETIYFSPNYWFFVQPKPEPCRMVIEEGIRSIGKGAFREMSCLHEVQLPESLESIGDEAFCGCWSLQAVNLPEHLRKIGNRCFCTCSLLRINLPESLEYIGECAFGANPLFGVGEDSDTPDTWEIDSVVRPYADWYIQAQKRRCRKSDDHSVTIFFKGDKTTLFIPASVTFIGDGAFSGTLLRGFEVADANPSFCAIQGVLYSKDTTLLHTYPLERGERAFTTPAQVRRIASYAFAPYSFIDEYQDPAHYFLLLNSLRARVQHPEIYHYSITRQEPRLSRLDLTDGVKEIGSTGLLDLELDTLVIGRGMKNLGCTNDAIAGLCRDIMYMTPEQIRNKRSVVYNTSTLDIDVELFFGWLEEGERCVPSFDSTYLRCDRENISFNACYCINYTRKQGIYYLYEKKGRTECIWTDDFQPVTQLPEGVQTTNFDRVFNNLLAELKKVFFD